MVYNTGNGASLQKLPDKSQISGKRQWILLLEIVKKESKTLNTFQKLLGRLARALRTIGASRRARQTARAQEMFMMSKLPTSQTSGNAGSTPK